MRNSLVLVPLCKELKIDDNVQQEQKYGYLGSDLDAPSKKSNNYFCKMLTASNTSTDYRFYMPRRAAEFFFPPLVWFLFSHSCCSICDLIDKCLDF